MILILIKQTQLFNRILLKQSYNYIAIIVDLINLSDKLTGYYI